MTKPIWLQCIYQHFGCKREDGPAFQAEEKYFPLTAERALKNLIAKSEQGEFIFSLQEPC